ncbi:MAG: hypothetical protein ACLQVY_10745 [Limisphaerales bacterium]
MIYFSKFKTICDVFAHNFEALFHWRSAMCIPHRMPDAARYFVAQRLDNAEAISRLYVNPPEHRIADQLVFPDDSILILPDRIFPDGERGIQAVLGGCFLKRLDDIQASIESLTTQYRAEAQFHIGSELLVSLASLSRLHDLDDRFDRKVGYLVEQLNRNLAQAFCSGGCQPSLARAWMSLVQHGQQLGFELEISADATAVLL